MPPGRSTTWPRNVAAEFRSRGSPPRTPAPSGVQGSGACRQEIVTHGDRRVDDYFWLRQKTNADVMAYLEAENAYTDAVMAPTKASQENIYREILGHLKEKSLFCADVMRLVFAIK